MSKKFIYPEGWTLDSVLNNTDIEECQGCGEMFMVGTFQ